MWTASALVLALLGAANANIIVYTQVTPHSIMEEFRDMPAVFGDDIPIEGLRGFLVAGMPNDGCTNLTKPPVDEPNFTGRWIVLIAKHNCTFETQIRNAQAAGFDAAIVHNVNSSELVIMTADDSDGIIIPSVFVSDLAGLILSDEYLYTNGFYIMVNSELPFNINTKLLLPFAIVVVLCLIVILIFMIVKCIKDRQRARRHRLPNRSLKKIPTYKFSKGDPYETCAICLDDYQEGEKLRVLPCAHAYHSACIDPWLTQNKRVCPVCKRRVLAAGERRTVDLSDSDSEPLLPARYATQRRVLAAGERRTVDLSDSDSEPLLPARYATQGGTFDEQRENPFARATRFMARLRARTNGEPEVPPSPPNDIEHMNNAANNDENGNTEETAPLLPAPVTEVSARRARRAARARVRALAATRHPVLDRARARGEIGVAALPASAAVPPPHVDL